MFKLSYSFNSVELLPIEQICDSLLLYGYSGVELSFQQSQFDPFSMSDNRVEELRVYFAKALIKPVAISTATTKFLSSTPHEPSLINTTKKNRAVRASLIARGIDLAEKIGVPLVSFQSGYLRDEHRGLSRQDVLHVLAEEIKQLLKKIRGSTKLVIEPEPGMFVETLSDAKELIGLIDDSRFGLHMDIGHVYCTESDYIDVIQQYANVTMYIHMADIRDGFNLKYLPISASEIGSISDDGEDIPAFYDIDDSGLYLFLHKKKKLFIGEPATLAAARARHGDISTIEIDKAHLTKERKESTDIRQEVLAYLDSVSGIEYERALRAYNAITALRLGSSSEPPVIENRVCNTINGKVHYHDLFGNGKIDYSKVISALMAGGYNGYCTIELYNHAPLWREIAPQSTKFIVSKIIEHFGWDRTTFGHIDHRKVTAPYVRVADAYIGPEGGVPTLYDLRLCQPNISSIPTDVLHTLEHCLLWILPKLVPGFLGVGPMGCQTGLYITTAFPIESRFLKETIISALQQVVKLDHVPYQSEFLCGMANNHNLTQAQRIAASTVEAMKRIVSSA